VYLISSPNFESSVEMKFSNVSFYLKQIADVITANISYTNDVSLFNGKTGIALFLYHYSDYARSSFYKDFAGKMLEEVSDNINSVSSPGFLEGLTGVGWAIEYFARNGFIEADTNEVLQELDESIFSAKLQRYVTEHDNQDMFGYGLYYLSRHGNNKRDECSGLGILKKQALLFLTEECERMLRSNNAPYALHPNVISSVAFFLLELNRHDIYPEKATVLLRDLDRHFETAERFFNDRADRAALKQLKNAVNFCPAFSDPSFQQEREIVFNPINESCKAAFHELVYAPYYKNTAARFLEDALHFFEDADWLRCLLQPSGHYNLALNNGMAGVGIAMLSSVK
jgi:hypothetical protein